MRRALIFAAGRGERLRPLTDSTPKPLIEVGGKPLIVWHLEKLAAAGVREVVINTSHLAEQFEPALGDGSRWGIAIRYSYEGPTPLETGGGMRRALDMFQAVVESEDNFIAVSADIWSDYDYANLSDVISGTAHLVMVPNPDFHPRGDFNLNGIRLNEEGIGERLTFANIGVYRRSFIDDQPDGAFKLLPLFQRAMRKGDLSGERYDGHWHNIGNVAQMVALNNELKTHTEKSGS
ncbi:MAG: N-acetylmuramate alpha-1-phosphate uridylyltransferase MurU [Dokdonella sp.]